MSLGASLPPQEKYLIAATHYRILNETDKAIESYENLVKARPNDATIQFDLGTLYEERGKLDQAQRTFLESRSARSKIHRRACARWGASKSGAAIRKDRSSTSMAR